MLFFLLDCGVAVPASRGWFTLVSNVFFTFARTYGALPPRVVCMLPRDERRGVVQKVGERTKQRLVPKILAHHLV